MSNDRFAPVLTYVGGPTLLIEIGKVRFLTDPTFDPGGTEYTVDSVPLSKTGYPAVQPKDLPAIDAVLLSHDQHKDNLDDSGRAYLSQAKCILTTTPGARRIGGRAIGLEAWDFHIITSADGTESVKVTATPARHGPPGCEHYTGAVTGFCLEWEPSRGAIYISGDTVWFDGVQEVARHFHIDIAVLFLGAAVIESLGPVHHTMTADEAVQAAVALDARCVVPAHFDGWEHFSQGKNEASEAFKNAQLERKLMWLEPGRRTSLAPKVTDVRTPA